MTRVILGFPTKPRKNHRPHIITSSFDCVFSLSLSLVLKPRECVATPTPRVKTAFPDSQKEREKQILVPSSSCHGENGVLVVVVPVDDNKGPCREACGNNSHSLVVVLRVGRSGLSLCGLDSLLYACCGTDWFIFGMSWTNDNKTNKQTVLFRCNDNHHQHSPPPPQEAAFQQPHHQYQHQHQGNPWANYTITVHVMKSRFMGRCDLRNKHTKIK